MLVSAEGRVEHQKLWFVWYTWKHRLTILVIVVPFGFFKNLKFPESTQLDSPRFSVGVMYVVYVETRIHIIRHGGSIFIFEITKPS